MILGLHPRARVERSSLHSTTAAVPLLLVSGAGVVVSALIWATRGWADALAVYVATVAALGLMLLWMARGRRHEPRPSHVADTRESTSAPADAAALVGANTGLSLAKSLAETESGLHHMGG